MHTKLEQRALIVLGDFAQADEITAQIMASCEVFKAKSTVSLSDEQINDRVTTLMDFAQMVEDSLQARCTALPQLAAFLIHFKIAPKENGVVSADSAELVNKLVRAGRKVFDHDRTELADTLTGLINYAERNDLGTVPLLRKALKAELA
jgi:hypothetical protein